MTRYYHSATYGDGIVISRANGEIVVKFPHPPGMVGEGRHVIPIIHYSALKDVEEKEG
jgi:hypothetical protein